MRSDSATTGLFLTARQCACVDATLALTMHALICQHGGLVIQRHNEIRDLEAEFLEMVCHDVEIEPCLQPITGEELN